MNKPFRLFFLFFFLLFLQVFVLNNILLFGSINPYLYIIFVFLYPLKENKIQLLFFSFLFGLLIDFFSDTGGVHAFAITFIAYLRLFFVKVYFRKLALDYPFFKLQSESFGKRFNYVVSLTVIHHLLFFLLINFSFYNLFNVLTNTFFSSIFTLVLYFIGTTIFTENE